MNGTMLRAGTKAERVATAEFAVSTGFTTQSDVAGSVRCTLCGQQVSTVRQVVEYQLEPWPTALVGALVAHLDDVCRVVTR